MMHKQPITIEKAKILLSIARSSIVDVLVPHHETIETIDTAAPWLQEKNACFVTLTQNDQLRGCIGTLQAHRSLLEDIRSNARAAAFNDPRFSPLTSKELNDTQIEVSLLSATKPLDFVNEQQALSKLLPGVDGVVFEYRNYRSTFLPQVWEQLPDVTSFMAHLKQKAGLDANFWSDEVNLSVYAVDKWKELDLYPQQEVST